MPLAMFGSVVILSGWIGQQSFPWLFRTDSSDYVTEYLAFIFLLHLIGTGFLLAGLAGTFAEINHKLLAAAVMLNKPPSPE
jgi:hypothetical protein